MDRGSAALRAFSEEQERVRDVDTLWTKIVNVVTCRDPAKERRLALLKIERIYEDARDELRACSDERSKLQAAAKLAGARGDRERVRIILTRLKMDEGKLREAQTNFKLAEQNFNHIKNMSRVIKNRDSAHALRVISAPFRNASGKLTTEIDESFKHKDELAESIVEINEMLSDAAKNDEELVDEDAIEDDVDRFMRENEPVDDHTMRRLQSLSSPPSSAPSLPSVEDLIAEAATEEVNVVDAETTTAKSPLLAGERKLDDF